MFSILNAIIRKITPITTIKKTIPIKLNPSPLFILGVPTGVQPDQIEELDYEKTKQEAFREEHEGDSYDYAESINPGKRSRNTDKFGNANKLRRAEFHSQTTTPMMDYPADYGVVGKTVKMSPQKFLRYTQSETGETRAMDTNEYEKSFMGHDKSYMEELATAVKGPGLTVPLPYIETERGVPAGHEGRHRALAARMAGKQTIPVRVVETDRGYIQEKGLRSQYTRDEENAMFEKREAHWDKTGEKLKEPVEYGEGKLPRHDTTKTIPHWLLEKLNDEEREQVEKELLTGKANVGEIAERYNIPHPSSGPNSPYVFMTNEQMLEELKNIHHEQGGRIVAKDLNKYPTVPSPSTYNRRFGSFNKALTAAGLPINEAEPLIRTLQEKTTDGRLQTEHEVDVSRNYTEARLQTKKEYLQTERGYQLAREASRRYEASPQGKASRHRKHTTEEYRVRKLQKYHDNKDPSIKSYKPKPHILERAERINKKLMSDNDGDGVNNTLDCDPNNPNKQGYIHNGQAVLYHGTTKDNAKRIVKAGLKAQENMFGEPAVFLTPSFQHAVYHGTKKKYVDPNVKPAVLEVSVPKEETGLTDEQIRDEEHPLREVRIYRNVPAKNIKLSRKQIKTAWGDSDKDGIPNVFDKPKMVRAEVKKKKKLIGGIGIIREKLDMGGEYGTLDTVDEEGTITNTAGKHLTGAYWEFEPDSKITLEKVKKKRKDFDYLVSLKSKADADKLKKEFDELYRPDMFGGKNPSVSYYDDKTLMINIPYSGMKRYRQNDLYEAAVDEKDTGRVIYNFAEAANVHLTRVKKIGITRQNENKLSKETTMEGTTDAAHRAYLVQKGLQDNMSPEEFKEYYTKHRGHLENKKKRKDFEYLVSGNEKDINELKRDVWKDYPEAKIITTNKGTIVSFPYKFIKNMRDELYTDYGEYVDDVGEYMKYIFTTDTKRKLEFKPIGVTKQEQQRLDRTHNKETIKTENKNMFINLVNAQDEKRESEKKMAEEGKKILEPHIQKIMKKHNVSKQDAELYLTLAFSKFEIKSDNDIELAVDDIIKETDERRKRK